MIEIARERAERDASRTFRLRRLGVCLALASSVVLAPGRASAAPLSDAQLKLLAGSKYVYVSSQRKDGSFSPPAEIWFMVRDGAVWVGTPKTTWRARRIAHGRTAAKIHIGSPTGPEFDATAAIVTDPALWNALFESHAKKYPDDPDSWRRMEKEFRSGAADGSRVLIRYTPK